MIWDDAIPQVGSSQAAETDMLLMDEEVFAGFYHRTARSVWAYLARVSGNAALADDLLQESYLRFLCAGRWKNDEDACRRYLFRIATNLMRDHWRRPQTTALEEVPEAALAASDHRDLERIDSQAVLGPGFSQLNPRERQLLWLAYAEGCSHREIAQIMGLGTTSVRVMLFRARRRLARLLRANTAPAGRNK